MIVEYQKHADCYALIVRAESISEGIDLGLLMSTLQKDGIPRKKWGADGIRLELKSTGIEA